MLPELSYFEVWQLRVICVSCGVILCVITKKTASGNPVNEV